MASELRLPPNFPPQPPPQNGRQNRPDSKITTIVRTTLLAGMLATVPLTLDSHTIEQQPASQHIQLITSSELQGLEWVRQCIDQYPEILWLANADVRKTEEGRAIAKGSYSEELFNQKFIEFDRTIMTLRCLRLILDGSENAYREFTEHQGQDIKLSKDSFLQLHQQGMVLIQSNDLGISPQEMRQTMEAALVLGDIGKSERAREIFKPYGAHKPDHDDFHGEVLNILQEHSELCPTFARLSSSAQSLLCQTADLAHYGHITHLEGGPAMFSHLRESTIAAASSNSLSFDLFIHTCDVAGACGHIDRHSSLVYTELTHRAMQGMINACMVLSDSQKTELDAYNAYLTMRASWLDLNPAIQSDRVLARVGAMLRLFTPEEGRLLKSSIETFDPAMQSAIIQQFDIRDGKEFGRTPTYMPAVLVNLANNPQLGSSKEDRLSQAVTIGIPFLARVLAKQKELLEKQRANPDIPLNFNLAAGVAKTNPDMLKSNDFTIDAEGTIRIETGKYTPHR